MPEQDPLLDATTLPRQEINASVRFPRPAQNQTVLQFNDENVFNVSVCGYEHDPCTFRPLQMLPAMCNTVQTEQIQSNTTGLRLDQCLDRCSASTAVLLARWREHSGTCHCIRHAEPQTLCINATLHLPNMDTYYYRSAPTTNSRCMLNFPNEPASRALPSIDVYTQNIEKMQLSQVANVLYTPLTTLDYGMNSTVTHRLSGDKIALSATTLQAPNPASFSRRLMGSSRRRSPKCAVPPIPNSNYENGGEMVGNDPWDIRCDLGFSPDPTLTPVECQEWMGRASGAFCYQVIKSVKCDGDTIKLVSTGEATETTCYAVPCGPALVVANAVLGDADGIVSTGENIKVTCDSTTGGAVAGMGYRAIKEVEDSSARLSNENDGQNVGEQNVGYAYCRSDGGYDTIVCQANPTFAPTVSPTKGLALLKLSNSNNSPYDGYDKLPAGFTCSTSPFFNDGGYQVSLENCDDSHFCHPVQPEGNSNMEPFRACRSGSSDSTGFGFSFPPSNYWMYGRSLDYANNNDPSDAWYHGKEDVRNDRCMGRSYVLGQMLAHLGPQESFYCDTEEIADPDTCLIYAKQINPLITQASTIVNAMGALGRGCLMVDGVVAFNNLSAYGFAAYRQNVAVQLDSETSAMSHGDPRFAPTRPYALGGAGINETNTLPFATLDASYFGTGVFFQSRRFTWFGATDKITPTYAFCTMNCPDRRDAHNAKDMQDTVRLSMERARWQSARNDV